MPRILRLLGLGATPLLVTTKRKLLQRQRKSVLSYCGHGSVTLEKCGRKVVSVWVMRKFTHSLNGWVLVFPLHQNRARIAHPMNPEVTDPLFENLTVMALGAPLISACLRFKRSWQDEYHRGYVKSADLKPAFELNDRTEWSFGKVIRKVIARAWFRRKLVSSPS